LENEVILVMTLTLIGPSQFVDERGRLFAEDNGKVIPVRSKETEAEDRYVERHLGNEGGNSHA
jgi:hypothetical protein